MESWIFFGPVSEEAKTRLTQNNIPFDPMFLNTAMGILIRESDYARAVGILGTPAGLNASGYEGIKVAVFQEERVQNATVRVVNNTRFMDNSVAQFRSLVREILVPAIEQNEVAIDCDRGYKRHLAQRKSFMIYLAGGIEGNPEQDAAQVIWGRRVGLSCEAAFGYSRAGTPIADGPNVIAEVFESEIFILHPILRRDQNWDESVMVLKEILVRAAKVLDTNGTPEERAAKEQARAEAQKQQEELRRKQNRDRYVERCLRRVNKERGQTTQKAAELEKKSGALRLKIMEAIRELKLNEALLTGIKTQRTKLEEEAAHAHFRVSYAIAMALSPPATPQAKRAVRERIRAENERYAQNYAASIARQIVIFEETIRQNEQGARNFQQELEQAMREREQLLSRLDCLAEDFRERQEKEFARLLSLPKIEDIAITDKAVEISTSTLFCKDPRTNLVHEIGRFKIALYDTGAIVFTNLTRQVDTRAARHGKAHAPHVDEDGNPCLGNLREVVPQLLGEYEYAAAALLAIQFIESVNVNDAWGTTINCWPVAQTAPTELREAIR